MLKVLFTVFQSNLCSTVCGVMTAMMAEPVGLAHVKMEDGDAKGIEVKVKQVTVWQVATKTFGNN